MRQRRDSGPRPSNPEQPAATQLRSNECVGTQRNTLPLFGCRQTQ